jgi:hypothetical protein
MFLFLSFMCFFFYKIGEQECGIGSAQWGCGLGTGRRGEVAGKGVGG